MPKENNSNNYVSTKEQKNKRKGGEKKKEIRGRGRKPYPTDPTTCTRGQATTAASAIDSASRIFRWREAAIIHERCHYARKPYTIASVATLRATDYTLPTGRNQSCLLLDHPPRIVVDNAWENQLGTVPNEKKPDDRQTFLRFTVYLLNHEIVQPLKEFKFIIREKR